MLQNSMVAGIDLTTPRRSAGLIFRAGTSVRLISCWKTPQNAGNSLSEPPDPSRGSRLRWPTRLSQNPRLLHLLPYDEYLLAKPCIYMLQVAAVI
jgi:hypothetical protein